MGLLKPTLGKIGISTFLFYIYLFPLGGWNINSGVSTIRLVYHLPLSIEFQNILFILVCSLILIIDYFLSCIVTVIYGRFRTALGGVKRLPIPSFFKPSIAKVAVTLILITIPFALVILDGFFTYASIFTVLLAPFTFLDDLLFSIIPPSFSDIFAYVGITSSIFFILYILARYLIACVIVSLFNALNIKSNKKRAPPNYL